MFSNPKNIANNCNKKLWEVDQVVLKDHKEWMDNKELVSKEQAKNQVKNKFNKLFKMALKVRD